MTVELYDQKVENVNKSFRRDFYKEEISVSINTQIKQSA